MFFECFCLAKDKWDNFGQNNLFFNFSHIILVWWYVKIENWDRDDTYYIFGIEKVSQSKHNNKNKIKVEDNKKWK